MNSAIVTGGADGIGAGIATALARLGYNISILDIDEARAQSVADGIRSRGGQATAVRCDVSDDASQERAFEEHLRRCAGLDIAVLNAGIMESGDLFGSDNSAWKRTLDVNLLGVIVGVRLSVKCMTSVRKKGTILLLGSAGGVFPMPYAPIYSTSKAGVVMLTQSLGPQLMQRYGIGVAALCPQFTDTALIRKVETTKGERAVRELTKETAGRFLRVEQVVDVGIAMLMDARVTGECAIVLSSGDVMRMQRPRLQKLDLGPPERLSINDGVSDSHLRKVPIPVTARKIVVCEMSTDFKAATAIVSFDLPKELAPGTILVKNFYCGVNASDVNFTSGRYQSVSNLTESQLDAGFEAAGLIAAVGPEVSSLAVGHSVATMQFGGFSEYAVVSEKNCFRVGSATPEMVALLTSGLTASIALEQAARVQPGETVLVTAAGGGTGQFFVQLAKLAGCHVVATCGNAEKQSLLQRLGADRIINYTTEDVKQVLKQEYPKGVDVVCELVGGEMFETCLNSLATGGRLVIIGAVSQYAKGWKASAHIGLPEKLLMKSAALVGFFLPVYARHFKRHMRELQRAMLDGKLTVAVDPSRFVGLESVAAAVAHLHSGKSMGKVVVRLSETERPRL